MIKSEVVEMSRAERRRDERKNQKLYKWLMTLTRDQRGLLTEYCKEATKSDILAMGQAFERVLRVNFQNLFDDIHKAEKYLEEIIDLVQEEAKSIKQFSNGSVEYMANLNKCKGDIIKKYEDKKVAGIKEKEIFNELKMDYPRFTLSAIKNVIAEHKRELRKASPVVADEISKEDIVREIFKDEVEVDQGEDHKSEEIKVEVRKEIIDKKSKLVEVTQIREFIGQYGSYKKSSDGTVSAGELEFKNIEDIQEWEKKTERSLEEERLEFEKMLVEKKNKAYGKLGEIKELLTIH